MFFDLEEDEALLTVALIRSYLKVARYLELDMPEPLMDGDSRVLLGEIATKIEEQI